ncbi:VC0807 family protein [Streptomyces sp. NPDC002574]|uniref:VC0807 family protein n=1 Tax=Streptomyces sp. NPDC002574 TaxID=3364652 RepID=UPI0036B7C8FB
MSGHSRVSSALGWALTIVCNIVLPVLTYNRLTAAGWGEFSALLVSGVWPVLETGVSLAWRRKVDEFAIMTLIFLAISVLVTVVGPHSTRLLLVKDSAVTGLFGVVCLASLLAPRPLMFYFGRKFGTDGTKEGAERFDGLWQYAGFRQVMRTMTVVWGAGYVLEALARVGLSYRLSTATMVTVNSVLSYAVTGVLIAWTILYGRRSAARGQERARQAAAASEAAAPGEAAASAGSGAA